MGIGLLIVVVTLVGGAVLSAQSSINGTISRNIGLLETVFFTFASGTLILAVLINFLAVDMYSTYFMRPNYSFLRFSLVSDIYSCPHWL